MLEKGVRVTKFVLDKGFIEIVDRMGGDYDVLQAARVSTGAEAVKGQKKDRRLIRYLYKNEHQTPFEQIVLKFHARWPLFVNQQVLRHRTFAFNQESARYKEFVWDCYEPEEWRKQDLDNKQGSLDELDFGDTHRDLNDELKSVYEKSRDFYYEAVSAGVAREQARTVMPMGQYTEIFFTVDLRNLLHFLELRMDTHAQKEIRDYANAIYEMLMSIDDLKWTMEIFTEMFIVKKELARAINKFDRLDNITTYLKQFSKE